MRRTAALQDDARRWQMDLDAARSYQQFLVPVLLQPWAIQLVDRAALSPGCRVLDLACGTGVAARIAAERVGPGGEVVSINLDVAMLSVARPLEPFPAPAFDGGGATPKTFQPPARRSMRYSAGRAFNSFLTGSPLAAPNPFVFSRPNSRVGAANGSLHRASGASGC